MSGKRENNLILIENGHIWTEKLDARLVWSIGRVNSNDMPDIKLHTQTVSRQHGSFRNTDGIWFYCDKNGKNGTVLNGKHISPGIRGRVKPQSLKDGDILIFGGPEEEVINSKVVWAMFSEYYYDDWRVEDTRNIKRLCFCDNKGNTKIDGISKGARIRMDDGIAIYMGDITYLAGDISVKEA
ncbi:MAG: FHA domain-containing protein [Lachnospiraceae bacterium]|nr:FHA domain-containing protein [Lachnospiraceae bacterium]